MKRFYLILIIALFSFFIYPKINQNYDGIKYLMMSLATIVGELIIPFIFWYILHLFAMRLERIKNDPLLSMKLLLIVAAFSALTSIGLIFPEFSDLFNG